MTGPGKFWAVIPAAGIGTRFGAELPKQYLKIHGRTILDISIGRLLNLPQIEGLYVSIAQNDPYWKESEFVSHGKVVSVTGGRERFDSVLNALRQISEMAD